LRAARRRQILVKLRIDWKYNFTVSGFLNSDKKPCEPGISFRSGLAVAFDLVIFDCDGVLVDSEVISCRAHAETLTRHGYPITAEQVLHRFLGVSDREARLMIESETGWQLPSDFEAQIKAAALRCYVDELRPIAHVAEAIAAIELPRCVASSGTPEKIHHGLTCAGLYELFAPNIFSATQVARGKPAPDLFLLAAERMEVLPARCLVIEDSVAGITGARAAGMTALGFHGGSHCGMGHAEILRAAGAAETFGDMRQLPALVALKSSAQMAD
jgi:HAD superfamily hydrolase (TIGR01509 family)